MASVKVFIATIFLFLLMVLTAAAEPGGALVGGFDLAAPSVQAFLISRDSETSEWSLQPLPDYPFATSLTQVTLWGTKLFAAGGIFSTDTGTRLSDAVYSLDLSSEGKPDWGWVEEKDFRLPTPRYSVSLAVQIRRDGQKGLFIFGGKDETGLLTDAWQINLQQKNGWEPIEPDFEGAVDDGTSYLSPAVASGTTHIIFWGTDGEKESELRAYNVITNRFFSLGQMDKKVSSVSAAAHSNGEFAAVGSDSEIIPLNLHLRRNRLGSLNITVITLYFLLMAGMGWFFSRRQKGTDDYFKGGERVPWWAVGISLYGAALSAISYMSVPAKSYMTNWELIFLSSAYIWGAPIITWFFIPRMRKYNLTSAYEYLEKRFHLSIRTLGSLIFIAFQVVRMAVMLFLPAIAINVVTNFDILTCIILVGVVSIVYTMFGGIEAVIWTDVLQVVILMGGLILSLAVISCRLDGGFWEILQIGWAERKFQCANLEFCWTKPTIWVILTSSLFLFLVPLSSDQTMVQRFFVGKGDDDAAKGVWTLALITLPGTCLLFFLGTAFYVFYKAHPEACSVFLENNDALLPWFMITQLPAGFSGLLIVAILAASMSSLSASMNSIATAWTVDFHRRLFRFSEKSELRVARLSTLFSGTLAVLLAAAMVTWDIGSFWDEYNRLLGLVTSSLAGIFFLGLLTKRANTAGALTGLLLSFLLQLYVMYKTNVYILLYSGTGFLSAIVFGYGASLFFHQFSCRKRVADGERSNDAPSV